MVIKLSYPYSDGNNNHLNITIAELRPQEHCEISKHLGDRRGDKSLWAVYQIPWVRELKETLLIAGERGRDK